MKGSKKIGKITALFMMTAFMAAVLGGCGSGALSKYSADTAAASTEASASMDGGIYQNTAMQMADAEEGALSETAADVQVSDRKLIKTVDMSVETEEFDKLISNVEYRVSELGGYIEQSSIYNGSYTSNYRSRNANLTVRIPAEKLDYFITEIADYSNVLRKEERVEDVTLQYVDMESHKKALLAEQESLLSMLENAQSIEDIIAINEQLTEVRYSIESMESQLRTYDNKIDYSTVYLYVEEVEQYEPYVPKSTGERISEGFVKNLRRVGDGISNFFIELIIALPIIAALAVVIAVVVGIVYLVIRAGEKNAAKYRQKLAERRAQMPPDRMQGGANAGSRYRPANNRGNGQGNSTDAASASRSGQKEERKE